MKNIGFDLGGTLIYSKMSFVKLLQNEFNISLKNSVKVMENIFWISDEPSSKLIKQMQDMYKIRITKKFLSRIKDYENKSVKLYSDVLPVLTLLQNRYKMFAISNSTIFDKNIPESLSKMFSHIFLSYKCGFCKPYREIFLLASKTLKCDTFLFVGDSQKYDFDGARKAGFASLLIKRRRSTKNCIGAHCISSLYELPKILQYNV